jgi:hypothetical protein
LPPQQEEASHNLRLEKASLILAPHLVVAGTIPSRNASNVLAMNGILAFRIASECGFGGGAQCRVEAISVNCSTDPTLHSGCQNGSIIGAFLWRERPPNVRPSAEMSFQHAVAVPESYRTGEF